MRVDLVRVLMLLFIEVAAEPHVEHGALHFFHGVGSRKFALARLAR